MARINILIILIYAFSNSVQAFTIFNNPFQYAAAYRDSESNLQYLNARYYKVAVLRFISRDSFDLINRYDYADGNPVMNEDPSGHLALLAIALWIAAIATPEMTPEDLPSATRPISNFHFLQNLENQIRNDLYAMPGGDQDKIILFEMEQNQVTDAICGPYANLHTVTGVTDREIYVRYQEPLDRNPRLTFIDAGQLRTERENFIQRYQPLQPRVAFPTPAA